MQHLPRNSAHFSARGSSSTRRERRCAWGRAKTRGRPPSLAKCMASLNRPKSREPTPPNPHARRGHHPPSLRAKAPATADQQSQWGNTIAKPMRMVETNSSLRTFFFTRRRINAAMGQVGSWARRAKGSNIRTHARRTRTSSDPCPHASARPGAGWAWWASCQA